MLTRLQIRALLLGVAGYVGAFLAVSLLLTIAVNVGSASISSSLVFWAAFWLLSAFMLGGGGYISGWVAGERGLLHGFIVGLAGSLIVGGAIQLAFPTILIEESGSPIIGYFMPSAVLTTMGGGIGELFRRRRQSDS
ncbi:MAG: hypothetical protein WD397_04605 [Wenzhouxiangellaceae bacterium]